MKERACIYCGTTENLSSSDIIPDALTNAKIINPNVCRDAHNSKFSDMFEYEIIKHIALITNELDIKSRKGDKYAPYSAKITIDGKEYVTKISSDTELFSREKIMTTEDGKTKLGPLEKIKKFKDANDDNITVLDINKLNIEKNVKINLEVFFSDEMHRLMAKIAYEWYCLHNDITDKIDAFNNIIDFITTGNIEKDPVEFVSNEAVYSYFEHQSDLGNHTILSYIGLDGSVNVIVSFFGIAIYNIKLLPHIIEQCKNNAIYQILTIDAKRVKFCFRTQTDLVDTFMTSFKKVKFLNNIEIMMPQNMNDSSLNHKMMYILHYEMFQNELKCITRAC